MSRDELVREWSREERQPFSGWDFSYVDGRMIEEQMPWSYPSRAAQLMHHASSVVDLDTGGAERFLELREHWPDRVVATENYLPNLRLAADRLVPFGARMVDAQVTARGPLPFADGAFELVLNRHSAINAREVARILAPGGTFLTQQVHGLYAHDLLAAFDAEPQWPDETLEKNVSGLQAAGLAIVEAQEWTGRLTFVDVGAVVYYLGAVPWLVPGFSVATHLSYLLALQRQLESRGCLEYVARKYLIEAHKGGSHEPV
jgi:SAM-dependent methyltransferase